jgi:hypothetical protein
MTWPFWLGVLVGLVAWPVGIAALGAFLRWLGPPDEWNAERHRRM